MSSLTILRSIIFCESVVQNAKMFLFHAAVSAKMETEHYINASYLSYCVKTIKKSTKL